MSSLETNSLICSVCGEELKHGDNFCPGCGVSVKKDLDIADKKKMADDFPEVESPKEEKKSSKDISTINTASESKKIPITRLIYLVFGLILIVLLINYSSGVFEKPITSGIASNKNFEDAHKGVDLQNLQQINSLEEKVKNNPADKVSLLELAHVLNDSGFKDRAIEKYKQYLQIDPNNADVLVDMGVCFFDLGKYNDAANYMKQALKYQPRHQIAYLNLGIVNLTAGKHDEALNWWKQAVEIDPNSNVAKRAQELINSH